MEFYEKTLKREYIYKGKILNLRRDQVELPGGKISTREIVEHGGAVAVVPITENNEVVMVQQFRSALQKVLLEIPAGKLEKGENPADCAERELEEETGKRASRIEELFQVYTSPGFSSEILYLFAAFDLKDTFQNLDPDEILKVEVIPYKKALNMLREGKIKDAKTAAGLLAVKAFYDF